MPGLMVGLVPPPLGLMAHSQIAANKIAISRTRSRIFGENVPSLWLSTPPQALQECFFCVVVAVAVASSISCVADTYVLLPWGNSPVGENGVVDPLRLWPVGLFSGF